MLLAAALLRDPRAVEPETGLVSLVAALDFPARFLDLATEPVYRWPAAAFLPNALRHLDLPLVARSLAVDYLLLANPLDAQRRPLPAAEATEVFADFGSGTVQLPVCTEAEIERSVSATLRDLPSPDQSPP